jgi:cytochrome c biogenesis protein CcmG/thiol:disulfide interchange protein DsbE
MTKARLFQLITIVIIIALITLFAISLQITSAGQLGLSRTTTAPDFTFTPFDGQPFTLSSLRGKVVVLNIWASWCEPCKEEALVLENGWRTYKERGVVFLGADYIDTEPKAREFIKQFNITYPNGPDVGSNIYRQFRAKGVPETYFIDQQGVIRLVVVGPVNERQLTNTIEELLRTNP